jgi:DNA-binding transcriptional ArsR family regulator
MSNHSAARRATSPDDVFDALGEPVRRQIIARLGSGPTPVGKLADQLTVGRPAVSKHLRVLEGAGLVRHESRGTRNLYALAPEGMVVAQQWLVGMWDTALAAFADEVDAAVEEQVESHVQEQARRLARSQRPSRSSTTRRGGTR